MKSLVFLSPAVSARFTLASLPCQKVVFQMHPAEMCPFSCWLSRPDFFVLAHVSAHEIVLSWKQQWFCVNVWEAVMLVGGTLRDTTSYSIRQQRGRLSCIFYSPAFHSRCCISHDRQESLAARGGCRTVMLKADSHIVCRAHAVPLRCSDSAMSFVKVHVLAEISELLVQQFDRSSFL